MVRYMEFDIVGIVLRKGAARRLKSGRGASWQLGESCRLSVGRRWFGAVNMNEVDPG